MHTEKIVVKLWVSRTAKGFRYSKQVKEILLCAFNADPLMAGRSSVLSRETGLCEAQVQQWFNNQRKRH